MFADSLSMKENSNQSTIIDRIKGGTKRAQVLNGFFRCIMLFFENGGHITAQGSKLTMLEAGCVRG